MKLSEIVANIKDLKDTLSAMVSDKTKATADALSGFSAKLTALETGATSEITAKSAELTTANEKISSLNASLSTAEASNTALVTALRAACAELKLDAKADATGLQMVDTVKGAVTATLARLQVDASKVPNGVVAQIAKPTGSKKSLDEQIKERQQATVTK